MVVQTEHGLSLTISQPASHTYPIIIGENLFPQIASDLKQNPAFAKTSKFAIITDSNVGPLYAHSLENALNSQALIWQTFTFPAGEAYKNWNSCDAMFREMLKAKFGRDSAIIALGGGVVGDMAGFMSSIYNRGVPLIQIPTTSLAQADSSVGGKTAIDTEYGKNLLGSFKHPNVVYIDVATQRTLPIRHLSSGLAETIKHGIIKDSELFTYLECIKDIGELVDPRVAINLARKNCTIKGTVVEQDPEERGVRAILNYGHTIGHAIESISVNRLARKLADPHIAATVDPEDYLYHGEAVSIGMMVAGRISNLLGFLSQSDLLRQKKVLESFNLPTSVPPEMDDNEIIDITLRDKKARAGQAHYVLLENVGKTVVFGDGTKPVYTRPVEKSVVLEALAATRE